MVDKSDIGAEVREVADMIRPLLARRDPAVQSAILADLISMWLAGHFLSGDSEATAKMREERLADIVALVRELLPLNERMILQRVRERAH